jgi:serine/threonine protein kinase
MTNAARSPETVFSEAIEIQSPEERRSYLDRACQGDIGLRQAVEKLISLHSQAGDFLESPAVNLDVTAFAPPVDERPGTVIGPYKLLQQIGEGGMGVVFMAEQTEPIQRTVALKIIKPGMDTRQVIARFEAERQALAVMDHPNIAKVLDAGTTENGRPYFVMDLVKGIAITKYCDDHKLSLRERLELFAPVCQAVQHAHQKGIIHRDLKPTNVLVAEYDGKPVPKIIDFGVAKATAQRLTERTMFTEFGQVIGTVEYMSPEQASFNQLDIDTRSDIYSLGVLLYELLTGTTPFERQRLREAAFDEVLRIIREEEPPKPSTRLGTSETLPSIAANRHTEPARLSREVRGELDWIVMRALDKERQRRYQTVSALADDLQHYLVNEPVAACPPSKWYRLQKFVRRNKVTVTASTAVAAALIVGLVLASIGFVHASRQARIARERNAHSLSGWAIAMNSFGDNQLAESLAREALALSRELFPNDDPRIVDALESLSNVLGKTKPEEAISLEREAIPLRRKYANDAGGQLHLGFALDNLAILLERKGEAAEAEGIFREELPIWRKLNGNDHIHVANTLEHLATVLTQQKKLKEAEDCLRECVATRKKLRGSSYSGTVRATQNLIQLLKDQGKIEEAGKLSREMAGGDVAVATSGSVNITASSTPPKSTPPTDRKVNNQP